MGGDKTRQGNKAYGNKAYGNKASREALFDETLSPIDDGTLEGWSDSYFLRTRQVVQKYGDARARYALFMRRPVLCAVSLALAWLERVAERRGESLTLQRCFQEGDWAGAGEALCYIEGSYAFLAPLETLLLQKIGFCSVVANNAFELCSTLPRVAFLAMEARHCAGIEMTEMAAYGASVGSRRAVEEKGARGFVGAAAHATARFFAQKEGAGTMPHGLIGYAGSTLRAAEMFAETFPQQKLVVLVDYFGREIADSLEVCARFPERVAQGELAVRLDTHGGRFVEGLDTASSYAVLERHAPRSLRGYRSESELKHLIGTGVSAAAVWHIRERLDSAGFEKVGVVASSGFTAEKCAAFALAEAPVEMIGTGSYLPEKWSETQATADIVSYDGEERVKLGREFLLPSKKP